MQFIKLLAHLFVPHESNNQKAKVLHVSGLTVVAFLLIAFQLALNFLPKSFPSVLGYAASISPAEVIRLTNDKRSASGLTTLSENSTLSAAALAKGNDMLAKGYWAHFAPDGTSPWSFFQNFGYKYRYAGENLARDFSSPGSAVEAWMASPTHRENILNTNYREIGIGVVEGSLGGVDTTIIVQFFGTPQNAQATIPVAQAKEVAVNLTPEVKKTQALVLPTPTALTIQTPIATPTPIPTEIAKPTPTPMAAVSANNSLISPFQTSKNLSLIVVSVLLLILAIDLILVRRKKIIRIGGRTLAHIAFFGMILAVIIILKAGRII